ncbi:MAG: hypothetical protein GWP61_28340 [Chloroflexi bacterium]|nr:hypothetical protein [Chloroflexota bacterium]
MSAGIVFDIQRYPAHDGPGILLGRFKSSMWMSYSAPTRIHIELICR